MSFQKNVDSRQQSCYFNKTTSVQIFSRQIYNYFKTLTSNIFCGANFYLVKNSELQACSLRENDRCTSISWKLSKFQNIFFLFLALPEEHLQQSFQSSSRLQNVVFQFYEKRKICKFSICRPKLIPKRSPVLF